MSSAPRLVQTGLTAGNSIHAYFGSSFGASWGDYDHDGWLDLYVINSGTNGDCLYHNGAGTFSDASASAGITDTYDGRSAAWSDFDGDGDLDLYVANRGTNGEPDVVYYNDGDGTFTRYITTSRKQSYGAAWGDYDGDGDPDLLVTRIADNLSLYRNDMNGTWLRIRPLSGSGYQTCYGAQVRLYEAGTSNVVVMAQVDGGHGTGSQDAYDVLVGLPSSGSNRYDIAVTFPLRGDPLGTGTNAPIVIDKTINPDLGDVLPEDLGSGFIEVRENGRVFVAQGTLFVSEGEVWLLQNSGGVNKLTSSGGDNPSGSPDGAKFVFESDRNGTSDLFVKLITGGAAQALVTNSANLTRPAWATDNSAIAFSSDQDGNLEIYVVDIAGEGARNLTEHPSNDWDAAWSPNSAKIAFVSDRDGATNVWVMDYDGANATNLTATNAVDTEPAWSPDGLHIAFTSYRDTNAEIYVMNFDGTSPTRLTAGTNSAERHPTWNDDGTRIIFESEVDGTARLYSCSPDGTGVQGVTPQMEGRSPSHPMSYKYPPKSVVFGEKNGRITYWADPVNTEGGNFTIAETDFVLTGRGTPIQFTRFYNSQDPFDSVMGFGWRHSYLIELTREVNGSVTITWGDGHQDFYQPFGSNAFTRVFGTTPGRLKETPTGFKFTRADQTEYDFSVVGRLVMITDKNSNTVDLVYSEESLASVHQSNGRDLAFSYWSNRVSTVTDHTGRQIGFDYDLDGNLTTYTNVRGKAWQYTYDKNHRLTSKVDPAGVVAVSNVYGEVGRVIEQYDGNGALTTYAYEFDTTNLVKTTTTTDPLGRVVRHKYDMYRRLIAVEDGDGNEVTYSYDAFGNRVEAIDRLGNAFHYAMTAAGLPSGKLDPATNDVQISYNSQNNPVSHLDELGRLTQFAYDADGNLSSVTNALGDVATTTYNSHGQPTHMTDEHGRTSVLGYDANGDLVSITDPMGRQTVLSYDSAGRLVTVTDAESNTVSYTYTSNNLLVSVTDPRGGQTVYEYDDVDRPVRVKTKLTAGEWAVVSNVYDKVGRVVANTDPRGYTTSYAYDAFGNLKAATNALGGVTRFSYNSDNQVTQVVDAVGAVTSYEYDLNGRIVRQVLPGTNETLFAYDVEGQLVAATNAVGDSRHLEYDAAGQLIRATDERGYQVSRVYDPLGRVTNVIDQLTNTVVYAYDKVGNLIGITDQNGHATRYAYDGANNVVSVTNAAGNVTDYLYDKNNRLVTITDARTNTTAYTYDSVGQVVKVTYANGTSVSNSYDFAGRLVASYDAVGNSERYSYDAGGSLVEKADRLGHEWQWQYDELGRLIREVDANNHQTLYAYDPVGRLTNVVDHLGNAVAYVYDEAGRLTRTIGPRGGVEKRTYDKLGRLLSVTDPLNRTKSYEYDEAGNLTRFTAADSKSIDYQYDGAGRLVRSDYPDFTSAVYSYDPVGNLLSVVDGNGTTTNGYDSLNRLLTRKDVYGKTVGYEYDSVGNRIAIIYPDGKRVEYEYDSLNRMTCVEDWLTNVTAYAYDDVGNLVTVTNANDTRCLHTYDAAQQLVTVRNEKTDTSLIIAQQIFVRDPVGNVVREERDYPLEPTLEEGDTTNTYDMADQTATAGPHVVTHDQKGNLTVQGSTTAYQYDYANRLTVADGGASFYATYTYDDAGNRIARFAAAPGVFANQRFTLDTDGRLVSVLTENDTLNNEQAYYVYGIGLIARITPSGDTSTYHYDAIGSTLALTDDSGSVTDSYAYDPFGKVLNYTGTSQQPYRFVGRFGVADEQYGLLFMRARYYDVDLGRWLSVDPIGDPTESPYVYARQSPVLLVDPDGLIAILFGSHEGGSIDIPLFFGISATLSGGKSSGLIIETEALAQGDLLGGIGRYDAEEYALGLKVGGGTTTGRSMEIGVLWGGGIGVESYASGWGWGVSAGGQLGPLSLSWSMSGSKNEQDRRIQGVVGRLGPGIGLSAQGTGTFGKRGVTSGQNYVDQLMGAWNTLGAWWDEIASLLEYTSNSGLLGSLNTARATVSEYLGGDAGVGPQVGNDVLGGIVAEITNPEEYEPSDGKCDSQRYFAPYRRTEARMRASIDSLTRGRGWGALSGQYGETYSTASTTWKGVTYTYTYLSGYWYWNVSRCVDLASPRPTYSTWLAAHNLQRSAVRASLARNYTANGVNTPWLPEVYEAYLIDGKFAVYGK